MGHNKGSPEREVHSNSHLLKKDRNISNKQPNTTSTRMEEKQQTKPKVSRRKKITKIRTELNDIETKNQFKKSVNL